ncbi:hypothetical protein M422DRAFT_263552 [Sphaerobolus stellatus SS14]|uniref:Uncharacterized protein n=1 Tax=Sphaerobolus stellatus (strain SS14) TaxID=990650 RepID=A0A0C9TVT1_SPHS4|nr:hypothetical protein M422DRAFT_263552 [Sphaerobolus stellatus SS14]
MSSEKNFVCRACEQVWDTPRGLSYHQKSCQASLELDRAAVDSRKKNTPLQRKRDNGLGPMGLSRPRRQLVSSSFILNGAGGYDTPGSSLYMNPPSETVSSVAMGSVPIWDASSAHDNQHSPEISDSLIPPIPGDNNYIGAAAVSIHHLQAASLATAFGLQIGPQTHQSRIPR